MGYHFLQRQAAAVHPRLWPDCGGGSESLYGSPHDPMHQFREISDTFATPCRILAIAQPILHRFPI